MPSYRGLKSRQRKTYRHTTTNRKEYFLCETCKPIYCQDSKTKTGLCMMEILLLIRRKMAEDEKAEGSHHCLCDMCLGMYHRILCSHCFLAFLATSFKVQNLIIGINSMQDTNAILMTF